MNCKYQHFYKSRGFDSLQVWGNQVCVCAMPRRKSAIISEKKLLLLISLGKSFKVISKSSSEVHHSEVRKYIYMRKTFKGLANLPRRGRPSIFTTRCNAQINYREPKSSISDSFTVAQGFYEALLSEHGQKNPYSSTNLSHRPNFGLGFFYLFIFLQNKSINLVQ